MEGAWTLSLSKNKKEKMRGSHGTFFDVASTARCGTDKGV